MISRTLERQIVDPRCHEDGLALNGWRCQWVRAPGMKCTKFADIRNGAGAAATASM
ncbi:hypothetical protein [Nocardia sp. 348MFTsu5.1]|uniref:hypothetical protein n=1 Tax=Nocardia sp. 348MFTsu5.1 TaxID=1172185 RepID=UPI00037683AB|nr:hypothetical protein [Nocardia sp. 348MFTsu5.1]